MEDEEQGELLPAVPEERAAQSRSDSSGAELDIRHDSGMGSGQADAAPDKERRLRAWVEMIQALLEGTGVSNRTYAHKSKLTTTRVSRYRNGQQIPPYTQVAALLAAQRPPQSREFNEHVWKLWENAAEVAAKMEFAMYLAQKSVESAETKVWSLEQRVDDLRQLLDTRERAHDTALVTLLIRCSSLAQVRPRGPFRQVRQLLNIGWLARGSGRQSCEPTD